MKPECHFDALSVVSEVTGHVGSVSRAEVHLFAYLSCLMSLYRMAPVAEWGYNFAVTQETYPYSASLDIAIAELHAAGAVRLDESADTPLLALTAEGRAQLGVLSTFQLFAERRQTLRGVCASVLAVPLGRIRNAVARDADIEAAAHLRQKHLLLSPDFLPLLYEQFATLAASIAPSGDVDLFVPAVVWLTCLQQSGDRLGTGERE